MKRLLALWIGVLVSWWSAIAAAQSAGGAGSPWLAPRRPDGTTYAPAVEPSATPDAGAPVADAAAPLSAPTQAPSPPSDQGPTPTTSSASPASTPTTSTPTNTVPGGAAPTQVSSSVAPAAVQNEAALGSATAAPRRVSLARARLRLLDASYAGLASRSGGQRILDGIVSIGAGGVIFASSWLIHRTMSTGATTDLHPWLWATSGYLALQGIVNLAWAPARERLSRQYSEMPSQTAAQRRERMRFGERALDEMAADGHRRRILGGIANIAATTGLVLIPYAPAIFNGTPHQLGLTDAVVMAYGGVSVLFSVIQMFSQSEEERLRNAYYQQVELIRAERARTP